MLSVETIHKMIDREEFSHYCQGIYQFGGWERIGSEILLRSHHGNPEQLFQMAKTVDRLFELEMKSILKLLQTYNRETTLRELLFINLFPSTIIHPDFPTFIKMMLEYLPANFKNKVTFEIIESDKIENLILFKDRIDYLKESGFYIAIDDIGKGWSSLSMIIEIQPQYIKLDRYFSIDLSKSLLKQEMIKSLLAYSQATKSTLILEGIEVTEDLATAKYLGVHMCQGFLLDKPKPIIR